MKSLTLSVVHQLLKPRTEESNKGTYGHSLIVAGNAFKMGAAVIAARACLRAGTGLLTVNVPHDERFILQTAVPEAMLAERETIPENLLHFSGAGIGPGIGINQQSTDILYQLIHEFKKPLVLDADALTILANSINPLHQLAPGTILTPHSKEFDRLFGIHTTTFSRMETAIKIASDHSLVLVLKGHHTLVTFAGESFLNTTGNAGLAKGGSGDALTGVITAFLAQGYSPFDAARQGVFLHGLAADIALNTQSMESLLITDVTDCFGIAFKAILK